jgi:hypothetical protein
MRSSTFDVNCFLTEGLFLGNRLTPHGRYVHTRWYVESPLSAAKLAVHSIAFVILTSHLVMARKQSAS